MNTECTKEALMHGWSWSAQHPVPGPPPQPAAYEFEVILNFFRL